MGIWRTAAWVLPTANAVTTKWVEPSASNRERLSTLWEPVNGNRIMVKTGGEATSIAITA